jgi:hypothetical protein
MQVRQDFKYCPECGKNLLDISQFYAKQDKKSTPPSLKSISTPKQVDTKKKKSTFHKPSFKIPKINKYPNKKILLSIVAVFVILIVIFSIILLDPFSGGLNGSSSYGGRTFTVTIDNEYTEVVTAYVTIDNIKQGECGDEFEIQAGEKKTFNVNEDDLQYQRASYKIAVYTTVDNVHRSAEATNVTEYASF